LVALSGCSSPALRFDHEARELGMAREVVPGLGFSHVVYRSLPSSPSTTLHVYLDGDGSPWIRGKWVARDPTPRDPLVLELMARDTVPSVYLGRPCYHGQASEAACDPSIWTFGRYSVEVLESMKVALSRVIREGRYREVVLIGYSGGGTLAMLMAREPAPAVAIVTVAGNLDPDAWANLHGYRPLFDSLNPATQPPLPEEIMQLHYAGARDRNVPPSLIAAEIKRQHASEFVVFPAFDHACCWEEQWDKILAELTSVLSAARGLH
jgi:pimeloyl-ACP methyl ester carboxylesterase